MESARTSQVEPAKTEPTAPGVTVRPAQTASLQNHPPAVRLSQPASSPSYNFPASGQSLPASVLGPLESSFGVNLGDVRVHSDAHAQSAAGAMSTRAFTYGNQIFLGRGEQATDLGLIAHETA